MFSTIRHSTTQINKYFSVHFIPHKNMTLPRQHLHLFRAAQVVYSHVISPGYGLYTLSVPSMGSTRYQSRVWTLHVISPGYGLYTLLVPGMDSIRYQSRVWTLHVISPGFGLYTEMGSSFKAYRITRSFVIFAMFRNVRDR